MSLPFLVDSRELLGAETVEMIAKSLAELCLPPHYTAAILIFNFFWGHWL